MTAMDTSPGFTAPCLNPFHDLREDGVSLFTAVKNRRDSLEESLKTWVQCDWINEIVIVDWGSDESLVPLVEKYQDRRILLAVVADQPRWILSLACNLAARLTTFPVLLKMDADVKILEGFREAHPLRPGCFYTGNWRTAREENEKHLHGISLMHRNDFFAVNGYNEYIRSYGWDDIDLYDRLEALGLEHRDFAHDTLLHIPHGNRTAFQDHMSFVGGISDTEKSLLNSLVSRFVSESFQSWATEGQMVSFSVTIEGDHRVQCRAGKMDQHIVPPEVMEQCEKQAITERFFEIGSGLSRDVLTSLTRNELIILLNLFYSRNQAEYDRQVYGIIEKFNHFACSNSAQSPGESPALDPAPYPQKVNLGDQVGAYYGCHRSGWGFAFTALAGLHNPGGVFLDAFVERTFHWHPEAIRPHTGPWIGFVHVPPFVPHWFEHHVSNDAIFSLPQWQESLPHCRGLFTLSEHHRRALQARFPGIPVDSLLHPTEDPGLKWSWEGFSANPRKSVIQVGFWLRKLWAIHRLQAAGYHKIFLRKKDSNIDHLLEVEREFSEYGHMLTAEEASSVESIEFLPDGEYDRLLSENIVFMELYDASANNTIIECIVRGTPILVNPIDPVIEYLGADYPFYFSSLEEAAEKIQDMDLVRRTSEFLFSHPMREKFTPAYFLRSFVESRIYQSL